MKNLLAPWPNHQPWASRTVARWVALSIGDQLITWIPAVLLVGSLGPLGLLPATAWLSWMLSVQITGEAV